MIDGSQIRAARGLLNWTQKELSDRCKLSLTTIKRMETLGTDRSSAANNDAVQRALEAAGVMFISSNGNGAGVRLADPKAKD